MKHILTFMSIAAMSGLIIAGCGDRDAASPNTGTLSDSTTSKNPEPRPKQPVAEVKSSALGTKIDAEHFSITLTTEPREPRAGNTKLVATVLHHGKPITDAKVLVSLSMPSMNMGGPEVELKHSKGGTYEGAAKLSMGGDWRAKVMISNEEGHTNEFTYWFEAMQE